MTAISISQLNTTVNHEPRIQDLLLGQQLGLSRPRNIRKLAERYRAELERYGSICSTVEQNTGRGRNATVWYFNEGQALCLCAVSDAPNAPDAREAIIKVYMEARKNAASPSNLPAQKQKPGEYTPAQLERIERETRRLIARSAAERNWKCYTGFLSTLTLDTPMQKEMLELATQRMGAAMQAALSERY